MSYTQSWGANLERKDYHEQNPIERRKPRSMQTQQNNHDNLTSGKQSDFPRTS